MGKLLHTLFHLFRSHCPGRGLAHLALLAWQGDITGGDDFDIHRAFVGSAEVVELNDDLAAFRVNCIGDLFPLSNMLWCE
jgi:hypothetical protein